MIEPIMHLFIPWDELNTAWVCLITIVGVIKFNDYLVQRDRMRIELNTNPFE